MIAPSTLRLVLIVSCAHAMVHVLELALPSVEQLIAADYAVGKEVTGALAATWRLPFGLGAFAAGWLVDRFGAQRMLAIYLLGCSGTCILAGMGPSLAGLFAVMFTMGLFASVYHPAGLALISHQTTASVRPRALGIHGIFGSAGIGSAPFLAGFVLSAASGWRTYYLLLSVPALGLGLVFLVLAWNQCAKGSVGKVAGTSANPRHEEADWHRYFALTVLAMMMGFIYAAVLSFLPRYLDQVRMDWGSIPDAGRRNYLAGGILFIGCVGQYLGGRLARHDKLEYQLAAVIFAAAPCLVGMAYAVGRYRLLATGMFALVHFMHQPLYNSLIAKYSPRHRRSLAYGFSFAMGMGLGSLGAIFAGYNKSDYVIHITLAGLAALAGLGTLGLGQWSPTIPKGSRSLVSP
jgi:MFS family permease